MIQVVIKNLSAIQTHSGFFASQAGADEWVAKQKSKGERCPWGRPAWTETLEDQTTVEHEDQFTIEQTDITAALAAAEAEKAAIKAAADLVKVKVKAKNNLSKDEIADILTYILTKIGDVV